VFENKGLQFFKCSIPKILRVCIDLIGLNSSLVTDL